jgi:hypothetical protein
MQLINAALFSGALFLLSSKAAHAAESYETYVDHGTETAKFIIDTWWDGEDEILFGKWWNSAITYLSLSDLEGIVEGHGEVAGYDLFQMWSDLYDRWTAEDSDNHNFENHYVDDEGWWALHWIRAYDLTKTQKYLDLAGDLVNDMNQWQACSGGIWWSKSENTLTAVENVVYFGASAYLANRVSSESEREKYAGWAVEAWTFMVESGEWDPDGYTVGGDVDESTCYISSTNGPSSYTQGVLIGGLLEQAKYYDDEGYATKAQDVAHASITYEDWLDENGIFQNSQDNYTNDIATFKGVLMRFLLILYREYPNQEYLDFVTRQADSIRENARYDDGSISAKWQELYDGDYDKMCSTNSANQAIVAAAGMLKG